MPIALLPSSQQQKLQEALKAHELYVNDPGNPAAAQFTQSTFRSIWGALVRHQVDLSNANLKMAKLGNLHLQSANFDGADLSRADLTKSNLLCATFRNATLIGTHFSEANLAAAQFTGAIAQNALFPKSTLHCTSFENADLSNVLLIYASLVETNFRGATLTGIKLFGSARDDWKLDNVICDHVFLDAQGVKRTEFSPREFEREFGSPPTIRLDLEPGNYPALAEAVSAIEAALQKRYPDQDITLARLEPGQGSPRVIFYTKRDAEAADIKTQAQVYFTAFYPRALPPVERESLQLEHASMTGRLAVKEELVSSLQDQNKRQQQLIDFLIARSPQTTNVFKGPVDQSTGKTVYNIDGNMTVSISHVQKTINDVTDPQLQEALNRVMAEVEKQADEPKKGLLPHLQALAAAALVKTTGRVTDAALDLGQDVLAAAGNQLMGNFPELTETVQLILDFLQTT